MTSIDKRKDEHIEYAMDPTNRKTENSEFDRLVLEHDCVPEISFDEIDISSTFLNRSISAPLIIGAMTGGSREGDSCLLYTSPSPRDRYISRMPSSA